MTVDELIIASHFCGPPQSGSGGYVSGLLARQTWFEVPAASIPGLTGRA